MKRKGAFQFYQRLGVILKRIRGNEQPLLIENNTPSVPGVIRCESLQHERTPERSASERLKLLGKFKQSAKPATEPSLKILRELRYGNRS